MKFPSFVARTVVVTSLTSLVPFTARRSRSAAMEPHLAGLQHASTAQLVGLGLAMGAPSMLPRLPAPASHRALLQRLTRLTPARYVRRGAARCDGARPPVSHQPPGGRVTGHAVARRLAGPALGPGPLVRAWRQRVPTQRGMHRLGCGYTARTAPLTRRLCACRALQRRLGYRRGHILRGRSEA